MHILKRKAKYKPGSILKVGKNDLIVSTIDYPIKITKFLSSNTKKLKLTDFKPRDILNEKSNEINIK
jgi:methionyl-tRNA formyltransferase